LQTEIASLNSQISVIEATPFIPPAQKRRQTAALRQQMASKELQVAHIYEALETAQRNLTQQTQQMEAQRAEIIRQSGLIRDIHQQVGKLVLKQESPFLIQGHSQLRILDHTLFTGDVRIDRNQLFMDGIVTVFPQDWPVQAGGEGRLVINSDGTIYFHADANLSLNNFVLVGAALTITNNSVEISGTWLGAYALFGLQVEGGTFLLAGNVGFNLSLNFTVGPIHDPLTKLEVVSSITIDTTFDVGLDVRLGSFSFHADGHANFVWNQHPLSLPSFSLDSNVPSSLEALGEIVKSETRKAADNLFGLLFKTMKDWLKAAVDGLVTLVDNLKPAVEAARQWGAEAWDATEKWGGDAWHSAYQWSSSAWNATTQWGPTAWRATTQWNKDAWAATTQWSSAAWNATTQWSADAWNATTGWSVDTWNDSIKWTDKVWGKSASWTADQWKDVRKTVDDLLKSHGDVALIQHGDLWLIQHGDAALIPHVDDSVRLHGDTALIQHGDISLKLHGDTAIIPHGDIQFAKHIDTAAIPHVDEGAKQHIDTAFIPHVDTPSVGHLDIPAVLHWDTPHGDKGKSIFHWDIPHGDTRSVGHGDKGAILHGDIPTTLHGDIPLHLHGDIPQSAHLDSPQIAHVDTPETAHIDTPERLHVDTPETAHIDTPERVHGDTPQTAHIDVPRSGHVDTPETAHIDIN
jgi:hypothetical protein